MGKNVLITGASGMIGNLILQDCLQSAEVDNVISLVRKSSIFQHHKFQEVVIDDFKNYDDQQDLFNNIDSAYFCIGVYTGQVEDALFKEITVDYAVQFAQALQHNSPQATLCLLSGQGADRKEKSSASFARYKGMAENQISDLALGGFYTFRPGYIYPVSPRKEPSLMYRAIRVLYPVIRLFGVNFSIKSTELAKAMFKVGLSGAKQEILENKDILEYA